MDSNGGSSRNHPQPNLSDCITVWFKLYVSYVTLYISFQMTQRRFDMTLVVSSSGFTKFVSVSEVLLDIRHQEHHLI